MMVDLVTLVEIRRRMENIAAALVMNPECQYGDDIERRVRRIMNWMGATGRMMTRPYVYTGREPEADSPLRFKRGGLDHYAEKGGKVVPIYHRAGKVVSA